MAIIGNLAAWEVYFNRLKVIIEYFNLLETRQTATVLTASDYPILYMRNQILSPFNDAVPGAVDEVATLDTDIETLTVAYDTFKARLLVYFEATLEKLGRALNVETPTDYPAVLEAITRAMDHDDVYVTDNTKIIDTNDIESARIIKASPIPSINLGTGKLLYVVGSAAWNGEVSIPLVEDMHCDCIDSGTSGQEIFQLSGRQLQNRISSIVQGSGLGPTLTVGGLTLLNWALTNWTGGTPAADDWTIESGAWGTEVSQSVIGYRGAYSLDFDTDLTGRISQTIPTALLPDTYYAIGLWARCDDITDLGRLFVEIYDPDLNAQDTIYLEAANALILDIDDGTLALNDTWYFISKTFKTQGRVRTDWEFSLRMDGAGAANALLIDALQIVPLIVHNGIQFGIFAGDVDFGLEDNFGYEGSTSASTHKGFQVEDDGSPGTIQQFITRMYGKQITQVGANLITDP